MKNTFPKISIITPSFNQGQFIEQTIRSVLLQNYPNLEYIIIDGGSTDKTIEILKKYDDFITYWVSEPDEGQSHAINKGLAVATGDIFNWLNSDDYLLPNALLIVSQYFEANKETNVFCGQLYGEYPEAKLRHIGGLTPSKTVEESLVLRFFYQQATFFKLSVVKKLGGISNELFFCMDLELWINYLSHFGHIGVAKTNEHLGVFRLHEDTKTYKSHYIRYTDHINLLLCLINSADKANVFPNNYQKDNPIFNRYFYKKYPIKQLNNKRLCAYVAEILLEYYCQYMSWSSLFSLYFYVLKLQPFNPLGKRFYFLPLVKIKRWIKPI